MNSIFTNKDAVKSYTKDRRNTELSMEQLINVANVLYGFYLDLEHKVKTKALKRYISDIASHCKSASRNLTQHIATQLTVPTNLVQSLFSVKTWYEHLETDFDFTSDESLAEASNERLAKCIGALRDFPKYTEDTSVRFLLSDWIADLQLTHDQLNQTLYQMQARCG